MADVFTWNSARKIAWREARAASTRFLFVVAAVALGVGALTGVRGFSQSFRTMLLRDARKLMAADLTVRVFELPTPEQNSVMASLEQAGVARTAITETVSMLSTRASGNPVLVSIKAVDPAVYPFYGELKLAPPAPLPQALQADAVAASDDLFVRLDLKVGDRVKLGASEFRIAAAVAVEPDRMAGSLNVGPRVLMSRQGLERAELIVEGSRAAQRFLFRVPAEAPGIEQVRKKLKEAFPEGQIVDYRETHPLITRGLDRATRFLSLVSLIALVVGALGVAMAMHSHLQQKMDSIAVMKCVGARSGQIMGIYTLQTLMLGLLGGVAGIIVGLGVERAFPSLIARYFHFDPGIHWDTGSAVQGLAIGLLTTLLFTLPPLMGIRRVRPSLILRRDMEDARPAWRERLRHGKASISVAGVILGGMLGIVWWLSDSLQTGLYFAGGFLASVLILLVIAAGMLAGLRRLTRRVQQALPATVRHGIANIYRPGNQASALLVALGVGVMFTLTIYLLQTSVLAQLAASAPPDMPNVFLINITPKERDGIANLLKQHAGGDPEVVPVIAARIVSIDGKSVEDLLPKGLNRRFLRTRSVTWRARLPAQTEVIEGAFWQPDHQAARKGALFCASEEAARVLVARPGARFEWVAGNKRFHARLACIYRSEAVRMGSNLEFLFNPGALEGLPTLHYAAARMKPSAVARLQRAVFERFPTVTVINAADVLAIVQEVVDQIALVVRFISFFAILAGAIILASSVAGTRFRRIREVVILKTLGATRGRIAGIFSIEFLILGGAAGILGSVLATVFSLLVLKRLFQVDYRFDPWPHLVSIAATAAVANAAGWLASHRILAQKPLEALRESL